MKFHSTRGNKTINFFEAIAAGLAEKGGLFVPDEFPDLSYLTVQDFKNYTDFAIEFLGVMLNDEATIPLSNTIIKSSLNFPLLSKELDSKLTVLECFHGPTLSFKDFGARFLARSLNALKRKLTVLVATSGDTGSAVASSFYELENINVIVLYPKGKITKRQEAQITCFGKNILAVEVDGVFDDCQSLVKEAFSDPWFKSSISLSTANSINIGRLLPQMSYYAYQAIRHFKQTHKKINFIVPGGNLGNVTACVYARQMHLPIGDITIATNSNKALINYYQSGQYQGLDTIETLANAMDVGAPSNFERLIALFKTHQNFKQGLSVYSVNDDQISQAIEDCYQKYNYIICPHTATAYHVAKKHTQYSQCIISTAHPAKFEKVIEAIIKQEINLPQNLKKLLDLPKKSICINPDLNSLKREIVLFLDR